MAGAPPSALRQGLKRHGRILGRALRLFLENGAMTAAGNMAFLAMLSLFPFLIFLVAVSGFLGQTERGLEAIAFLLSVLPPEVGTVIEGPIAGIINNTGAEILTFSILFAIWTAANGIEAIAQPSIAPDQTGRAASATRPSATPA